MNIHSGLRPYKCRHCPKDFTNFPNWLKHTRRRHKVDHKTGEKLMVMPNFLKKLVKPTKTNELTASSAETATSIDAVDPATAANPSAKTRITEQAPVSPLVVADTTPLVTTEAAEKSPTIPMNVERTDPSVTTKTAPSAASETVVNTPPFPMLVAQTAPLDVTKTVQLVKVEKAEAEMLPVALVTTEPIPLIVTETVPSVSMKTAARITPANVAKAKKPRRTKKADTLTTAAATAANTTTTNTKAIQSTSSTSTNVSDHIKYEEPLDIEYIEMENNDAQVNAQQTTQLETTDLSTITVNNRTLPLNTLDDLERAASLLMYPQLDLDEDLVFANIKTDQYDYEHDQYQYIDQTISYEVDSIPFTDANDMSITYSYYPSGTQCDFTMMPLPPINTVKSKRNTSCDSSTPILPGVGEYFIRRHKEKLDQL